MTLLALPPELYFVITSFLEKEDLAALLRANKQIYHIVKDILYCHDAKSDSPSALLWAVKKRESNIFMEALPFLRGQCTSDDEERSCTIRSILNKALCLASSGGYINIIPQLLDAGADANTQRRGRATPLELASLHRHEEIIEILTNRPVI